MNIIIDYSHHVINKKIENVSIINRNMINEYDNITISRLTEEEKE